MKTYLTCAVLFAWTTAATAADFNVVEATIPQMQAALKDGRITSHDLVLQYLARIATYENVINPTIAVSKQALAEADALDRERAAGKVRGPLHGIPVALKDNIHTTRMPTTAGALAFAGLIPPYEATLTTNLRAAGAIIIAKTVLTEMANWMVIGMPNNYSAIGGFSFNPYDARRDPRPGLNDGRGVMQTGSSSSGGGTTMSLWAANVGTETTVSIINPSSNAMLVGIKPTLGRVSRYGIVPVSMDQDTAGPMTRSVTDAALMLGAMESASPDPHDDMTKRCTPPAGRDYTQFLKGDALKGARIGVPRAYFIDSMLWPGTPKPSDAIPDDQKAVMNEVVALLRAQGATVVDPADAPSVLAKDPAKNMLVKGSCTGSANSRDGNCSIVLKYSFKRDFKLWLDSLGAAAPFTSLAAFRQWNTDHASMGALKYRQDTLDMSDEMDLDKDRARYDADRAQDQRLTGAEGFDKLFKQKKLDAVIFAGSRGSSFLAKSGYPTVSVPYGMVANGTGYPPGFTPKPMPMGVAFSGLACSEPRLLALAYAFEQATKKRRPPEL